MNSTTWVGPTAAIVSGRAEGTPLSAVPSLRSAPAKLRPMTELRAGVAKAQNTIRAQNNPLITLSPDVREKLGPQLQLEAGVYTGSHKNESFFRVRIEDAGGGKLERLFRVEGFWRLGVGRI